MSVTMAQAIIHGPTDITINLQYDSGRIIDNDGAYIEAPKE